MDDVKVAISSDFLTAFAALPRQAQRRVTEFINKFRNNPRSAGINYEKVRNAVDNKMYSVRIDDTYRGIVVRQEHTGVYLLLWVDHHDEAYAWAVNKRCEINRETGNIQVFDVISAVERNDDMPRVFAELSDEALIKLGVPKDQVPFIRTIDTPEHFYDAKPYLPVDAFEALQWIVSGFPLSEVLDLYTTTPNENVKPDDFATALSTDGNKNNFVIVEGEEDLRRIMAEPLEKWRIFLHPKQRKLISKNFSGPVRILGGAGTGKTVVAMHRAKWLASQLREEEKVLFTTFTANLAEDIRDNLRKICSIKELKKIEVINLDAWVAQMLHEQGYVFSIQYGKVITDLWEEAIACSGEDIDLSPEFFAEEWTKVVTVQEAFSLEKYVKASRIGRSTRLNRQKKRQVWQVIEEYILLMKQRSIRDVDMAMYECRELILKKQSIPMYAAIVVDEGQDLGMNAYRLLRAIAGKERQNDIFIVGDTHQRIYKKTISLSKCGINIRGRSSHLRINYRTTEETRKFAFGILNGISFDDLDGEYEKEESCQSLIHGDYPQIINCKNANTEFEKIKETIQKLVDEGAEYKDICLVTRTHKLLDDYVRLFNESGIRVYEIKRNKKEDRNMDGIRIATMHRVKGLEFSYVIIAAANDRIIPLASAISYSDPIAKKESIISEKCLLYVALTRACKKAYIFSYGKASEFLK